LISVDPMILGPGDISQAHKPNEHVSLSEVLEASRIYARLAMVLLL